MSYHFYILYSVKLDKHYLGHSEDIDRRLRQHNEGQSKFTSAADDWVLVYKEHYNTKKEAFAREIQVKKKKSRKYIEWLINAAD